MIKISVNTTMKKIQSVSTNKSIINEQNAVLKILGAESGIPEYGSIFCSLGLKPKFASKSWRG